MDDKALKFKDIIGNLQAFRLMLDGATKLWPGNYSVIESESDENLFEPKKTTHPFFSMLWNIPSGEKLYSECQSKMIRAATETSEPVVDVCSIGVIQIAVPITIEGKTVATVLCDQVRSHQEEQFSKYLLQLETELGKESGDIVRLWYDIPTISKNEIESIVNDISTASHYISESGQKRIELQKIQLERQRAEDQRRVWLLQITHQLIAPLHGLQGYAEMILYRLEKFKAGSTEIELEQFKRPIEAIISTSNYA